MEQEVVTSGIELNELSNLERELYTESTKTTSDVTEDKSFWRKLSDLYFQPKFFEKSGKLYEALGVKWFRKCCPNGGSWWAKRTGYSFVDGKSKENLQSFVTFTKILEGVHAFGFFPWYTYNTINHLSNGEYGSAAVDTAIILINLYPIMSNRYNRNKTNQMLERLEEREARKMPASYK